LRILLFALLVCSAASLRAAVVIDDFTTGPHVANVFSFSSSASDNNTQSGAMLGGSRETAFGVFAAGSPPIFGHLDVGSGSVFLTTIAGTTHRLDMVYAPAGADLSAEDRFRFHFLFNSATLNFNVVVFSASGHSQLGLNIPAQNAPFDVDFHFADFVAGSGTSFAKFAAIDFIDVIFQTGTAGGGQSFLLASIAAVPEPASAIALAAGLLLLGMLALRGRDGRW
jgi:hypothetical protein